MTLAHVAAAHHAGKPYLTACGKRARSSAYPVIAVDLEQFNSARAAKHRCPDCVAALDGFEREPTISEQLFAAGFTHEPSGRGTYPHDVFDARGVVVFSGTIPATLEWLERRRVQSSAGAWFRRVA